MSFLNVCGSWIDRDLTTMLEAALIWRAGKRLCLLYWLAADFDGTSLKTANQVSVGGSDDAAPVTFR